MSTQIVSQIEAICQLKYADTVTGPKWLDDRETRAWRGYLRMRALLDLQISRDLARDSGLSDADYQVLATLSESAGRQRRLIDLAERMLWSKSRLGHHIDRMAGRGLVERKPHPDNSRATIVALTGQGVRTLADAAPDHVDSVRRHFIDHLTAEQIDAVAEAAETVIEHLCSVDGT